MKISYAITVCDEFLEIQKLLSLLLNNKRHEDEIVVLVEDTFKGHFANWKNILTKSCSGDYIFQIDADEIPNETLIENLPIILEQNPDIEVYLVPRVNTVKGLTEEHIKAWGWNVNDKGWVNWPDYQWRIWKNKPEIQWKNKVHEVLEGHKIYSPLQDIELLSLYHPKDIKRQEKQNNYYSTL